MALYLLSKLEYFYLIQYPAHNDLIKNTKAAQWKFFKYLVYRWDGVYPTRDTDHSSLVKRFNILLLECRGFILSVTFMYKLHNNLRVF